MEPLDFNLGNTAEELWSMYRDVLKLWVCLIILIYPVMQVRKTSIEEINISTMVYSKSHKTAKQLTITVNKEIELNKYTQSWFQIKHNPSDKVRSEEEYKQKTHHLTCTWADGKHSSCCSDCLECPLIDIRKLLLLPEEDRTLCMEQYKGWWTHACTATRPWA